MTSATDASLKKILVALARSSEASAIFESGLSVARTQNSEMLLIHFIDWQMQDVSPWIGIGTLYDFDLSGERYDWSRQRLQTEVETANRWLENLVEKARQFGIVCKYECHIGNCNTGIINRAKDWNADLLVIGRRGRKNISEMFLGSVSNYTIHHAPCSVLVVQGTNKIEAEVVPEASQISN